MKYRRIWGRFSIAIIALLALIIAFLNCSDSTSPPPVEYDWTLRIADLTNMEIPIGYQGTYIDIPIYLDSMPEADIDSFTILIAHDYAVLTFIRAEPGIILSGWDEFTYSDNKYFSSERNIMLGLTKITAKRVSLSASSKPSGAKSEIANQSGSQMQELFSLKFWVTDNRDYECTATTLDFFWMNCTDNVIYFDSGHSTAYSDNVYGIDLVDIENPWYKLVPADGTIDESDHFYGAFDDCWSDNGQDDTRAKASIDLYNCLVEIPCAEPIGLMVGDVNLNDIPYEIGDGVLFSN